MRKIFLALAVGAAALAPFAVAAAPAGASVAARSIAARPANAPSTTDLNYAYPQSGVGYTDLSDGILVINASHAAVFDYSGGMLEYGADTSECLYQDDSVTVNGNPTVDLNGCNASKSSDLWRFGTTSNTYSLWENELNGACAWGFSGADVQMEGCNGSDTSDRWHWAQ